MNTSTLTTAPTNVTFEDSGHRFLVYLDGAGKLNPESVFVWDSAASKFTGEHGFKGSALADVCVQARAVAWERWGRWSTTEPIR